MTTHQMLNNISHQDTKIITDLTPEFTEIGSYSQLILDEIKAAQADFPIFFRKSQQDESYQLIALFGLAEQENLFINNSGWQAHYVPLSIKRQPFLIGFQEQNGTTEPVVCIDMNSPRVNTEKGEAVFLPHGGQSGYLQDVSSILQALHQGHDAVKAFIATLLHHDLIEPVDLSITLDNQEKINIQDISTVNEDKLAALASDALIDLHSKGYLSHIYMLIASVANLTKLIALKNAAL
jgi:hypothetical protein